MVDNSNLGNNTGFGGYNFSTNSIIANAQNPYAIYPGTQAPSVLPSLNQTYYGPGGTSLQANGKESGGIIQPTLVPVGAQAPQSVSNPTGSNSAFNQNALQLASQAAQHSGLAGNTLGTLPSDINNIGSSWFGFSPGTSSIASSVPSASGPLGQIAGFFNTADTSVAAASDAAANALGTGTFVNAAGDSVAAGTPGAIELTGNQAASLAATGATSPGMLGGITLSGTLTGAGLGAIGGGALASALGENPLGGTIGGAIGGAAGAAFGGAAFSAMGMELGAFAGPLGILAGAAIGGIAGGLFGNNTPPTSDTSMYGTLSPTGSISGVSTSSKNPNSESNSFASSGIENFSSIANAANTALGIQFAPTITFDAADSTKHGGPAIAVSDSKTGQSTGSIYFNPSDPSSTQQAYAKALTAAASYSGYQDTSKLTDWYNNTYVNSNNGATNVAPSLPNNPNANQSASTWNNFITQYAANQNANAAPNQTTVGGKPVTSYQTQGTTNATPATSPAAA